MASEEVLKLFKIEKLKEEQSAILKCILEGRDCMAVLPTGFGKSLPYQLHKFSVSTIVVDEFHTIASWWVFCYCLPVITFV